MRVFVILLLLGSLLSCNRTAVSHLEEVFFIDISKDLKDTIFVDISEAIEDTKIVRLGSETDILLDNIHKVSKFTSGIIVNDSRGSYLFDNTGEYIRDFLKYGRGPEEFLAPRVLCFLQDTAVIIMDSFQSRDHYYVINIKNGTIGKIRKAPNRRTSSLIPLNDSTLAALNDDMQLGLSQASSFSLVLQDMNGELIAEYDLGSEMNMLGPGNLTNLEMGMIISPPSGRYFFTLNENNVIDTIWENRGMKLLASPIRSGNYDQAALGYADEKKILVFRRKLLVTGRMLRNTEWELLHIDKYGGAAKALVLYFFDRSIRLDLSRDDITNDGYISTVISPSILIKIASLPGGVDYLKSLNIVADSVGPDDNPYLLYGRIK